MEVSYNDVEAVVISPGVPLDAQDRVITTCDVGSEYVCDYFENENNSNDDVFEIRRPPDAFNDQLQIVCRQGRACPPIGP